LSLCSVVVLDELRKRAGEKRSAPSVNIAKLSKEEIGKLIHELEVHQIELEMQNKELRRSQLDLEELRKEYFDHFDLSPRASGAAGKAEQANSIDQ